MRWGTGPQLGLVLPSTALGGIGGLAHRGRAGAWGPGPLSRCSAGHEEGIPGGGMSGHPT